VAFRDNSPSVIRKVRIGLGRNLLVAGTHMENELRNTISRTGRRGFGKGKNKIRTKLKTRARNRDRGGDPFQRRLRSTVRLGSTGKLLGISVRSQPGEPPRRQTGFLWRSITHVVNLTTLSVRAGTNVEYGPWLEFGTRTHTITAKKKVLMNPETGQVFGKKVKVSMAPRPWVKPTFDRERIAVQRILSRPVI